MPHISAKKIKANVLEDLEKNIDIFLTDTSIKQRHGVFKEIITETERIMLAKRIAMVFLLEKGFSTYETSKRLSISPSTAERFQLTISRGKYKQTLSMLKKFKNTNRFLRILTEIISIPFEARRKSFKKTMDNL